MPVGSRQRAIILLYAYFDETGTHAWSPATFVAGFIGSVDEWNATSLLWKDEMKGETFHYKNMTSEQDRLDTLSTILADSKLQVIAAGFKGDWKKAISHRTDWKIRFPSSYHLAFELCIDQMNQWASSVWNDQPIALIFSRHDEYASRADEVWRTFRGNGLWHKFVSLEYGDPKVLVELQAADMIAYETFQCMKIGTVEVWQRWPLVRKLLAKNTPLFGNFMTTDGFVKNMEEADRKGRVHLKTVPKS